MPQSGQNRKIFKNQIFYLLICPPIKNQKKFFFSIMKGKPIFLKIFIIYEKEENLNASQTNDGSK